MRRRDEMRKKEKKTRWERFGNRSREDREKERETERERERERVVGK